MSSGNSRKQVYPFPCHTIILINQQDRGHRISPEEEPTTGQHLPEGTRQEPAEHSCLVLVLLLARQHQHLPRELQVGTKQPGLQGAESGQEEGSRFLGMKVRMAEMLLTPGH